MTVITAYNSALVDYMRVIALELGTNCKDNRNLWANPEQECGLWGQCSRKAEGGGIRTSKLLKKTRECYQSSCTEIEDPS